MRLVVAGSPAAAVPTLRRLAASAHDIAAVLTRPATPQGRKRTMTPTPVATAAAELGVPVIEAERVDAAVTEQLDSLGVDLGVIVAYGALLRRAALEVPGNGWINLHFSDLPSYRGAAPVQRAVMAGETRTAATVFRLVEALDAGPVYASVPFTISADATAGEVLAELAEVGAGVVADVVDGIAAGTATAVAQTGVPTLAPKLVSADGHVQFDQPADRVFAQIRGVTPEPGAFADLGGERVKVLRAASVPDMVAGTGDAGTALDAGALALWEKRAFVGTADRPLELLQVQPAGRRPMDGPSWLRGLGDLSGKVLR